MCSLGDEGLHGSRLCRLRRSGGGWIGRWRRSMGGFGRLGLLGGGGFRMRFGNGLLGCSGEGVGGGVRMGRWGGLEGVVGMGVRFG